MEKKLGVWSVKPVAEAQVQWLTAARRLPEILARLLVIRGVKNPDEVEEWLNPSVAHLNPAELLPDFEPAQERILRAIKKGETILVWGHDDLDGITATVILCRIFADLQGKVKYHIPTKGRDKHGLDHRILNTKDNVRLIVTVDCGITNYQEIERLKEMGIDVVVTDHHETIDPLPAAVAAVDPKRSDSDYPYPALAGVGVALKLAMGIVKSKLGCSYEEFLSAQPDILTLAAIGTIADRVTLTGENRILVTLGLAQLERTSIPALRTVLKSMGITPGKLTVSGFLTELLPLFAAVNGADGVRYFLEGEPIEVEAWVKELVERSRQWREEAERSFVLAQENVRLGDGILFVQHKELSLRALGFCAARLKERYQVPAVVIGWRGDAWVGECRGMDGIDLMDLLRAMRNYFIDYGGHKKAAGFSIREERLADFIKAAEQFAHENFAHRVLVDNTTTADAFLSFREWRPELIKLAPFGEGNPQPVFISEATFFNRRGDNLVPMTRPDLVLTPGKREVLVDLTVPYRVIWTVDDMGRMTVLDARPSHNQDAR